MWPRRRSREFSARFSASRRCDRATGARDAPDEVERLNKTAETNREADCLESTWQRSARLKLERGNEGNHERKSHWHRCPDLFDGAHFASGCRTQWNAEIGAAG